MLRDHQGAHPLKVVHPNRQTTGTVTSRREDREAMFLVLVVLDPVAGPRGEAVVMMGAVMIHLRLLRAVMAVTNLKKKSVRFDLGLDRIPEQIFRPGSRKPIK